MQPLGHHPMLCMVTAQVFWPRHICVHSEWQVRCTYLKSSMALLKVAQVRKWEASEALSSVVLQQISFISRCFKEMHRCKNDEQASWSRSVSFLLPISSTESKRKILIWVLERRKEWNKVFLTPLPLNQHLRLYIICTSKFTSIKASRQEEQIFHTIMYWHWGEIFRLVKLQFSSLSTQWSP